MTCDLPDFAYDCDGNCLMTQMVTACVMNSVLGCTDGLPNFNPYATDDDGTCLVGGCTAAAACNTIPKQITSSRGVWVQFLRGLHGCERWL